MWIGKPYRPYPSPKDGGMKSGTPATSAPSTNVVAPPEKKSDGK